MAVLAALNFYNTCIALRKGLTLRQRAAQESAHSSGGAAGAGAGGASGAGSGRAKAS